MKEPVKREKLIFNLFGKTDFLKTFKIRKIFRKGLMISDQACPKKSVDFISEVYRHRMMVEKN